MTNVANRERTRKRGAEYRESNPEKMRKFRREWRQKNKGQVNFLTAKRRASKHKATPSWISTEQAGVIREFYIEAAKMTKETGISYAVDHIIPIQGINVSGLHVPWNLQIITAVENSKKGNRI